MTETAKFIFETWFNEVECSVGICILTEYTSLIPSSLEQCLESSENLNGLTLNDLKRLSFENIKFDEDLLITEKGNVFSLDEEDYILILIIFLILYANYPNNQQINRRKYYEL